MGIKGAAALFADTGRGYAQHRDNDENDRANGNLDDDVAAQLPERMAGRCLARASGQRRRKPKPIDRRKRQHHEE